MKKHLLIFIIIACSSPVLKAQEVITLSLEKTIQLANDSSLEAYRSKNIYLSGYWEYRTFRAARLPSLTFNAKPAQYYRDITRRYDSEKNVDIYRAQQSFSASGNLTIKQNFDLTGGTFYLDTEMGYIHNFGVNNYTQYTSIPMRLGYSQDLIGYNPFKWDKKIQPLKYERQKKELILNMEKVAIEAIEHFFTLAMAQMEYEQAVRNVNSTDTLYRTGMKRYEIAAISQADLLTLKLDAINAQNALHNMQIELKRAMFSLASYLNFDRNTEIYLELPEKPADIYIISDKALEMAKKNNPTLLTQQQTVLEAEQKVDKTKKESRWNISFNASIGFNQVSDKFKNVYHNPMQQDLVSISISVPIVDWGIRKGRYNMAKNDLNIALISARKEELQIEEDILMTVDEFNTQSGQIKSAEEALHLSILAYEETKQRFLIGKADINSMTLSLNRQQTAHRNYMVALKNYWKDYYKIRKLTLYDFHREISLNTLFDFKM